MELAYRFATIRELAIYFRWTNDSLVRNNSFDSLQVTLEDHTKWFKNKLLSEKCFLYFFLVNKVPAGQVRIEIGDQETVIGISIDEAFRGKSLSSELLIKSTSDFLLANSGQTITAYVKVENTASYKSFLKAGFSCSEILDVKGNKSYKLIKQ